tara:strand:+ start:2581 stop:4176 length:1596 start_codon:yes stop_codon:yes gene_type:complete
MPSVSFGPPRGGGAISRGILDNANLIRPTYGDRGALADQAAIRKKKRDQMSMFKEMKLQGMLPADAEGKFTRDDVSITKAGTTNEITGAPNVADLSRNTQGYNKTNTVLDKTGGNALLANLQNDTNAQIANDLSQYAGVLPGTVGVNLPSGGGGGGTGNTTGSNASRSASGNIGTNRNNQLEYGTITDKEVQGHYETGMNQDYEDTFKTGLMTAMRTGDTETFQTLLKSRTQDIQEETRALESARTLDEQSHIETSAKAGASGSLNLGESSSAATGTSRSGLDDDDKQKLEDERFLNPYDEQWGEDFKPDEDGKYHAKSTGTIVDGMDMLLYNAAEPERAAKLQTALDSFMQANPYKVELGQNANGQTTFTIKDENGNQYSQTGKMTGTGSFDKPEFNEFGMDGKADKINTMFRALSDHMKKKGIAMDLSMYQQKHANAAQNTMLDTQEAEQVRLQAINKMKTGQRLTRQDRQLLKSAEQQAIDAINKKENERSQADNIRIKQTVEMLETKQESGGKLTQEQKDFIKKYKR